MGKGKKKKSRGKKKGGNNTRDWVASYVENDFGLPTKEQKKRAVEAALNRKEDPLKNWECPHQDECPICMISLPHIQSEYYYYSCCGKNICCGCLYSNVNAVLERDGGDVETAVAKTMVCPFCREEHDDSISEFLMKQAQDGQHEAMYRMGLYSLEDENGLKMNEIEGMEWLQRAVEAGSGKAAATLGSIYLDVEDCQKAFGYFQKGAELGFVPCLELAGVALLPTGEIEEAMLNLRKAAVCGASSSILFGYLRRGFSEGFITKEEYAYTLRENQKACNELNSEGRQAFRSTGTD